MDEENAPDRIADLERQLAQQQRIAELERQLAEAKSAVGPTQRVEPLSPAARQEIDEHARRLADAMLAQVREEGGTDVPQLREALTRAVAAAGLSPDEYRDVLQRVGLRAGTKVTIGGEVVYNRCGPDDPIFFLPSRPVGFTGPGFGDMPGRLGQGSRVGMILGVGGGLFGLCAGGAAAVTALIPATALWMGPIVCPNGYGMTSDTSHYSYMPGQSGTTVSFQCVNGESAYDVNDFAVFSLQFLLVALVVFVAGGLAWRLRLSR
ncbi:hypothetical protein [Mycobacterium sp. Marseille-P9652]|uniref:hypothetical protein n=1 Tax=Mycobacterium sp. Marseille-P9652 TaxID=2654950 RepID=UPI0012E92E0B|nr:hypothetical protein [Mycobacterium sp. Marseille-P9652]